MNVVIGMAMGTACITPAVLEACVTGPGVPGLLTSAAFREAGEAVITLVAVVEPVTGVTAVSLAAAHCWMLAPGPEMMVAGPGRMWARVPVYSGFS